MEALDRSLLADLVTDTKIGDTAHIAQLLSMGVRPDVIDKSSGWSALHASVVHNPVLLPILLEHAVNPDGPTVVGGTPLAYVIHELGENPSDGRRHQLLDALALLLQAGADPRHGAADQSALELARLYGLQDVEIMLSKGTGKRQDAP